MVETRGIKSVHEAMLTSKIEENYRGRVLWSSTNIYDCVNRAALVTDRHTMLREYVCNMVYFRSMMELLYTMLTAVGSNFIEILTGTNLLLVNKNL